MKDRPAEGPPAADQREYLLAGDYFVADQPTRVTTILGSCVSVCLWDEERRAGGLNHYLMPRGGRGNVDKSTRFADVALPELLEAMRRLGSRPADLVAKVFGGAGQMKGPGAGTIGSQNVEAARAFLAKHRIPVRAKDVGGPHGRRLVFFTADGTAWIKTLG